MQINRQLEAELGDLLGVDNVCSDAHTRSFYSQDISRKSDHEVSLVIRPSSKEHLAAAVKLATSLGYTVFPRGGGMSYTGGYLPTNSKSICVDMSHMNRVLEINETDMFVTVEAGCTWAALHKELEGSGLRTPFWGTLSGLKATVGGGVSQNGIFWGSGLYGTAAESVTGLEVVLADGTLLKTGANAKVNGSPFQRYYGPDTTGLFLADAGAMAIKATVTLRLIKAPKHVNSVSFSFQNYNQLLAAASEVSRSGLASESFGFDPYLQNQRLKRESLMSDVKTLGNVVKSGSGIVDALKKGVKVALAGRGFVDEEAYSYHFVVEAASKAAAEEGIAEISDVCSAHGATKVENSIPEIIRANPFVPLNGVAGPSGERWLPMHALVPHSKAEKAMMAVSAYLQAKKAEMDAHSIHPGFLFATVGTSTTVIEPVFFWPDELMEIHRETIQDSTQKNFEDFGQQSDARALVFHIRTELINIFDRLGAVHMQIGKTYPYEVGICDEAFEFVRGIKRAVDPENLINPGSLVQVTQLTR